MGSDKILTLTPKLTSQLTPYSLHENEKLINYSHLLFSLYTTFMLQYTVRITNYQTSTVLNLLM